MSMIFVFHFFIGGGIRLRLDLLPTACPLLEGSDYGSDAQQHCAGRKSDDPPPRSNHEQTVKKLTDVKAKNSALGDRGLGKVAAQQPRQHQCEDIRRDR